MAKKKYEESNKRAIADAIREKTKTEKTYKTSEMDEGVNEVYETGKTDGLAEGREATLDDLFGSKTDWSYFNYYGKNSDIIAKLSPNHTRNGTVFRYMFAFSPESSLQFNIDTSSGTDFKYMFYDCQKLTTAPTFDTSSGTVFDSMFRYCYALKSVPEFDTSNGTDFKYMFEQCKALTSVTGINTSKSTTHYDMFYNCQKLTSINQIDFSNTTNVNNAFYGCTELVDLDVVGTISISGLNLQHSTKLSHDSLLSIYNALEDKSSVGGTWKLTIGSTNLAKLTDEEKEIAINKGWTVT